MKIFLDECVDWRLSREIPDHEVRTARDLGWTAIKNGELLALAAAQFDVFVTVDRNLRFQQKLQDYPIAVLILEARSNRLADWKPLIVRLLRAIKSARPGQVEVIGI